MKKQFIILSFLLTSLSVMAQDTSIECKHLIWGVYPCLTYYNKDFKTINSAAWMLHRPGNSELMSGFGVNYGNPGKCYASVDFSTDILHEEATSGVFGNIPTINVSCHTYTLAINTFFLLIGTKKYGIYGNLGTSFERILLHSENHNTVTPTDTFTVFENLALKQNFLLNGGISFYFYNTKLGFATGSIAIKAGYDWAPVNSSVLGWYQVNGNTKTEGVPPISFNGFYIGIVLNVWRVMNTKSALR